MQPARPILAVGTRVRMLPDQLCSGCHEAYQQTPHGLGTILWLDGPTICDDGERCRLYAVWVHGYSDTCALPFIACDRELEPLD